MLQKNVNRLIFNSSISGCIIHDNANEYNCHSIPAVNNNASTSSSCPSLVSPLVFQSTSGETHKDINDQTQNIEIPSKLHTIASEGRSTMDASTSTDDILNRKSSVGFNESFQVDAENDNQILNKYTNRDSQSCPKHNGSKLP